MRHAFVKIDSINRNSLMVMSQRFYSLHEMKSLTETPWLTACVVGVSIRITSSVRWQFLFYNKWNWTENHALLSAYPMHSDLVSFWIYYICVEWDSPSKWIFSTCTPWNEDFWGSWRKTVFLWACLTLVHFFRKNVMFVFNRYFSKCNRFANISDSDFLLQRIHTHLSRICCTRKPKLFWGSPPN